MRLIAMSVPGSTAELLIKIKRANAQSELPARPTVQQDALPTSRGREQRVAQLSCRPSRNETQHKLKTTVCQPFLECDPYGKQRRVIDLFSFLLSSSACSTRCPLCPSGASFFFVVHTHTHEADKPLQVSATLSDPLVATVSVPLESGRGRGEEEEGEP